MKPIDITHCPICDAQHIPPYEGDICWLCADALYNDRDYIEEDAGERE
jgi:hypothetical protein